MKSKVGSVSVVMSTAHEPLDIVRQAVESILLQTLLPDEFIIIVEDASNTEVFEYLQKLADETPLLKVFLHQEQQGLAICRNEGIYQSTSDYVALMDADDVSMPHRLETELTYLLTHQADGVFAQVEHVNEAGESVGYFHPTTENSKRDIFLKHIFVHPTGFFKREVFKTEKYDPAFMRAQDIDLWIRLLHDGKILKIVPEVLLKYRVYRDSAIESRLKRQSGYAKYGFKIVQKHFLSYVLNPYFFYFTVKWFFYNVLLNHSPEKMLIGLVKLKDVVRKHKVTG